MTDNGKDFYPIQLIKDPRKADPMDKTVSDSGRPSINMLYRKEDGNVYQVSVMDQNRILGPESMREGIKSGKYNLAK